MNDDQGQYEEEIMRQDEADHDAEMAANAAEGEAEQARLQAQEETTPSSQQEKKTTSLPNDLEKLKHDFWSGVIEVAPGDVKSKTFKFVSDDNVNWLINQAISIARESANKVDGNTSDGFHTFNELYEFRKLFNAALFNTWYAMDKYNVHKSERHGDGELAFGGGWFIVMATLPTGQISNHYEMKDWDLFRCVARDKADSWDGHTAQDVIKRLADYLSPTPIKEGEK